MSANDRCASAQRVGISSGGLWQSSSRVTIHVPAACNNPQRVAARRLPGAFRTNRKPLTFFLSLTAQRAENDRREINRTAIIHKYDLIVPLHFLHDRLHPRMKILQGPGSIEDRHHDRNHPGFGRGNRHSGSGSVATLKFIGRPSEGQFISSNGGHINRSVSIKAATP